MTPIGHLIQTKRVREALAFMASEQGPLDTPEVIARAIETSGLDAETIRRAINDGVRFGVFRKPASRSGRQTGEVETTLLGSWWFALRHANDVIEDEDKRAAVIAIGTNRILEGLKMDGWES